MTSLVEEFKCANTSLEMILCQCMDQAGKNTAPTMKTAKKLSPRKAVQHAEGAVQHRDIIGQVQSGRAGFGLGECWKAWGKAFFATKKRKLDKQQRLFRQTKGQSMHDAEKRKISWSELWAMEAKYIKYNIGATAEPQSVGG